MSTFYYDEIYDIRNHINMYSIIVESSNALWGTADVQNEALERQIAEAAYDQYHGWYHALLIVVAGLNMHFLQFGTKSCRLAALADVWHPGGPALHSTSHASTSFQSAFSSRRLLSMCIYLAMVLARRVCERSSTSLLTREFLSSTCICLGTARAGQLHHLFSTELKGSQQFFNAPRGPRVQLWLDWLDSLDLVASNCKCGDQASSEQLDGLFKDGGVIQYWSVLQRSTLAHQITLSGCLDCVENMAFFCLGNNMQRWSNRASHVSGFCQVLPFIGKRKAPTVHVIFCSKDANWSLLSCSHQIAVFATPWRRDRQDRLAWKKVFLSLGLQKMLKHLRWTFPRLLAFGLWTQMEGIGMWWYNMMVGAHVRIVNLISCSSIWSTGGDRRPVSTLSHNQKA